MITNSIFIVKGISGSGKSSRVFMLLKYFEFLGLTLSDFKFTNVEGKERQIGILVEELSLLFIGKLYKSGDIERWQGYDAVTGVFCKAVHFSEFLQTNKNKYSFIIDGAGITQTHRLRPKFLRGEIGFNDILIQYYIYDNKQQYLDRIIYSSGEPPKKDVMWEKNDGFMADCCWSMEDSKSIKCTVYCNDVTPSIDDFGIKLLKHIKSDTELIDGFIEFVQEMDYVNVNKFINWK
jgi:hypothetical protein